MGALEYTRTEAIQTYNFLMKTDFEEIQADKKDGWTEKVYGSIGSILRLGKKTNSVDLNLQATKNCYQA
ncbi:MAG: hypothetical protein ABIC04_02045 [Nanoarchaeota archaeon]